MRYILRKPFRIQLLAIGTLAVALAWFPDALLAQTFTPMKPAIVNDVPIPPGYMSTPGNNVTTYFQNQSEITPGIHRT